MMKCIQMHGKNHLTHLVFVWSFSLSISQFRWRRVRSSIPRLPNASTDAKGSSIKTSLKMVGGRHETLSRYVNVFNLSCITSTWLPVFPCINPAKSSWWNCQFISWAVTIVLYVIYVLKRFLWIHVQALGQLHGSSKITLDLHPVPLFLVAEWSTKQRIETKGYNIIQQSPKKKNKNKVQITWSSSDIRLGPSRP